MLSRFLLPLLFASSLAAVEYTVPLAASGWQSYNNTVSNEDGVTGHNGTLKTVCSDGSQWGQVWKDVTYPRPIAQCVVKANISTSAVSGSGYGNGAKVEAVYLDAGGATVKNGDGTDFYLYGNYEHGTTAWKDDSIYHNYASFPGGAVTVRIQLGVTWQTGTAWYDGVTVEAWDAAGVSMDPVLPTISGGNLPTAPTAWDGPAPYLATMTETDEGGDGVKELSIVQSIADYNSYADYILVYDQPVARVVLAGEMRTDSVVGASSAFYEAAAARFILLDGDGEQCKDAGGADYYPSQGSWFVTGTTGWSGFNLDQASGIPGTARAVQVRVGFYRATGTAVYRGMSLTAYNAAGAVLTPVALTGDTLTTDTTGWVPFAPGNEDTTRPLVIDPSAVTGGAITRVTRSGDGFVAGGRPIKFWGTGVAHWSGTAAETDSRVARLRRLGVNMVRLHGLDLKVSEGGILSESNTSSNVFDAAAVDRMDYFVKACKDAGIYVWLDIFAKKSFRSGDGVTDYATLVYNRGGNLAHHFDDSVNDVFKPVRTVQKAFAAALVNHVNPYTGLPYATDPVVAMIQIINESNLFDSNAWSSLPQSYKDAARSRFSTYRGSDPGSDIGTLVGNRNAEVFSWLRGIQEGFYADMRAHLLAQGVPASMPVCGTNSPFGVVGADVRANASLDFIDAHQYADVPQGGYFATDSTFTNKSQLHIWDRSGSALALMGQRNIEGMPLTISEWDFVWPNEWCAEGALSMGAIAGFQGYDAMLQFGIEGVPYDDHMGGQLPEGMSPYRIDDKPHELAAMVPMAIAYLRGDITPGPLLTVAMDASETTDTANEGVPAAVRLTRRMAYSLTGGSAAPAAPSADAEGFIASSDGQLRWNLEAGILAVASPCTQGVVGFWKDRTVTAGDLTVTTSQTSFGQVIATSLDGTAISDAANILLTVSGRAENTGTAYRLFHRGPSSIGGSPILMEPVKAQVAISRSASLSTKPTVNLVDWYGRRMPSSINPADITISGSTVTIDLTSSQSTDGVAWYEVVFPVIPTVSIQASDAAAAETGSATGAFNITRTGATASDLVVNLSWNAGTAIAGTDCATLPSTVTIPAGQSSATVTVIPVDDALVEGAETLVGTVLSDAAYAIGTSIATVTIADNDVLPVTITSTAPPDGLVSVSYLHTYTASASVSWRLNSGSLPSGLTLTTSGILSGSPSAEGTFSGTVAAMNGATVEAVQSFTIVIRRTPTITSAAPGRGTVGQSYLHTYTATGTAPMAWSLTSGTLPPGLALSGDGILSGTPSLEGTFTGTVTVSNATSTTAVQSFTLVIASVPTITSATPAGGAVDQSYLHTYTADGTAPVTWSVTSGSLPPGLTLSASGVLSGIPTTAGTFTGTIAVANVASAGVSQAFSITIQDLSLIPLTYDGNGATGGVVPATQTIVSGGSLVTATNSGLLVKNGFSFIGWNSQADGTGTAYSPGVSLTMSASLTLYAQWTTQVVHTVTVEAVGHGIASPSGAQPIIAGTPLSVTLAPDAGYQLVSLVVDGQSVPVDAQYTFPAVTSDHTITAAFGVMVRGISPALATTGTTVIVSGSGFTASTTIRVGGVLVDVTRQTSTDLVFTLPGGLVDGPVVVVLTQDGVETTVTGSLQIDATAPGRPSALTVVHPITRSPTVSGNAEPGASVKVMEDGVAIAVFIAGPDGSWSGTLPVLSTGIHVLSVRAVDAAGNSSADSVVTTINVFEFIPDEAVPAPGVSKGDSSSGCGVGSALAAITFYLLRLGRRRSNGDLTAGRAADRPQNT